MNSTNSAKSSLAGVLASMREKLAISLINEMSELMFKIHHPDSGRVIESVIQLLPDNKMNTLITICVGNENDEIVQAIASTMIVRLAAKQEFEITSQEIFSSAVQNFLLLINCENLRRKNQLEYLWPSDLFSEIRDHLSFTKLTDVGTDYVQKELLRLFDVQNKPIQ